MTISGHPDNAYKGKILAIFCDSEFWHGFDWELKKDEIKTRKNFGIPTIERNIARDLEVNKLLTEGGWVIRF